MEVAPVEASPTPKRICTSIGERQNQRPFVASDALRDSQTRSQSRRTTGQQSACGSHTITSAVSHASLTLTMEAGITDRVWDLSGIASIAMNAPLASSC